MQITDLCSAATYATETGVRHYFPGMDAFFRVGIFKDAATARFIDGLGGLACREHGLDAFLDFSAVGGLHLECGFENHIVGGEVLLGAIGVVDLALVVGEPRGHG